MAEKVKARVKKLTPADTGLLRRTWGSSAPAGGSVEVFNNTEYAAHVEYGHRVVVHGNDTGKVVEGVFMLKDAMEDSQEQFYKDAREILKRLIK